MAQVFFPSALRPFTGGVERIEIEARDIRQLLHALEERFPGLRERIESGLAVAIDGEIINDPLLEEVASDSDKVGQFAGLEHAVVVF